MPRHQLLVPSSVRNTRARYSLKRADPFRGCNTVSRGGSGPHAKDVA